MYMDNMPLVSVAVVTYNSSKFVLETLESIKNQSYRNIELIVSDDCSIDDTVEVCREWIEKNKDRFVRTVLLESPVNTGVSANGNRAADACQGEWVKGIAGDDLLVEDCIESYLQYVSSHPDAKMIFGRIQAFGASEEKNRCFTNEIFRYDFFSFTIEEQLSYLISQRNCIPASTFFYNLNFARGNNIRNDETIPMLEDYPKWINILKKGIKFYFNDNVVVYYRLHENSLSTNNPSPKFKVSLELMFLKYLFKEQFKNKYYPSRYLLRKFIFAKHFSNEKDVFWNMIWKLGVLWDKVRGRRTEHFF